MEQSKLPESCTENMITDQMDETTVIGEGEDRFGWVSERAVLTWLPADLWREDSKVSFMFLPHANKPFTNMQSTGGKTVLQWEEVRILCWIR